MSQQLDISEIPQSLRPIAHFIKISGEYASRDIVIYYWCIFKAVEDAMHLDTASGEAKMYLGKLLTILEQIKVSNKDAEGITSHIVAQAHIEDQASKLFTYAEQNDAANNFNQKMMKAFYTSGYLFELLSCFGELDDSFQKTMKYAKWRATYIFQCQKKGEKPVPGSHQQQSAEGIPVRPSPFDSGTVVGDDQDLGSITASMGTMNLPSVPKSSGYAGHGGNDFNISSTGSTQFPSYYGSTDVHAPFQSSVKPSVPYQPPQSPAATNPSSAAPFNTAGAPKASNSSMGIGDISEARKYTKYAMSALDFEDPATAIQNLQKAIAILQKH